MQIATRQLADTLVATVSGRVDHIGAPQLEAALAPLLDDAGARGDALVLDFAGVDYISSVGLRVLMIASHRMREQRARLALANLSGVVAEIIAIARFNHVLAIFPDLAAALEAHSPAALAAWRAAPP